MTRIPLISGDEQDAEPIVATEAHLTGIAFTCPAIMSASGRPPRNMKPHLNQRKMTQITLSNPEEFSKLSHHTTPPTQRSL